MVDELKRLLRLLTPVDWLAAGVVVVGLAIALLLDEAAVRLIGVSIALLGAVAFFLLLSQRFGEEGPYSPTLRSQAAQLRTTVEQTRESTRLIFDDFAQTFAEPTTALPPRQGATKVPGEEFSDELSGVRIVKRLPRRTPPPAAPQASPTAATAEPPPARIRSVSIPEFVVTPSEGTELRHAFRTLLERLLHLVRIITPTRTALLFWLDAERQLLVLEAWQSETPELLSEQRKFSLGRDIVSQIATGGRAEIVTDIQPTAELELLPYYRHPAGTSSVVGVPIILQQQTVGVLCLDSTQPQAYTAATVSLLGHVILVVGGLLQSYIQHYDLQQKAQAWERARVLWELTTKGEEELAEHLLEPFATLTRAPVLLLCLYSLEHRRWRIAALRAPAEWHSLRGAFCKLEDTLVGSTIQHGELQRWQNGVFAHRLHPEEPLPSEPAYGYAIPLRSPTHAYGALYCELPEPLAPRELELLQSLGEWCGGIVEHWYWHQQLRGGLWFYPHQAAWSEEGFRHRIGEELERTARLHHPTVLCAVQLDRYGVLADAPPSWVRELLTEHVLPLLQGQLRPCDIIGYLSQDTLGILLPGMDLTQAQLWAETVRKHIATTVLAFHTHRLTVTLSIGLTDVKRHHSVADSLHAVQTALSRALQKGNSVILYG